MTLTKDPRTMGGSQCHGAPLIPIHVSPRPGTKTHCPVLEDGQAPIMVIFAPIVRVFVLCAEDLHDRLVALTVCPEATGLTHPEEAVAAFAVIESKD